LYIVNFAFNLKKNTINEQNKGRMNFIIALLTECVVGFYGENCTQKCGHCMDVNGCDKTTGECRNGCRPYWAGSKCDGKYLSSPNCLIPWGGGERVHL
jgi:hypothetical protein